MATPLLALTELTNKQANAEVPINLDLRHLERFATLNIIATQNAPGTLTDGFAYIVGTAGSGAWSGHNNQIAVAQGGTWYFFTPFQGIEAYDATAGESMAYNLTHGWYPLQDRWSTTEHWTGRYHGGAVGSTNRVYSKSFSYAMAATATTQNTAHSISTLDVGTGKLLSIEAYASNGTTVFPLPFLTAANSAVININATNIVIVTSSTAFSGYTTMIRLCYRKTV